MKTVYLSLGSNLGDREKNLEDALAGLEREGIQVVRRSSIYETEPQDLISQPWFLNLVVEVKTRFFPIQLLGKVQKIERELGRLRTIPKGPRVIDIDILLYGRFILTTPELTIPHAALPQRRFVVEPLAELAPDLLHPVSGKPIKAILEGLRSQQVRKWTPSDH